MISIQRSLRYSCAVCCGGDNVVFLFEDFALDCERRELRSGGATIPVEPQVFDILVHLIENRDRVVSKDDLIASVWNGRIVSDSTLDSRINAVRKAVGDSGGQQRLVRTMSRKGFRFVGAVTSTGKAGQARGFFGGTAATRSPLLHGLRRSPHRLRCGWTGTAFGQGSQLAQPSRIRLAKPDLERAFARTCRITSVGSV